MVTKIVPNHKANQARWFQDNHEYMLLRNARRRAKEYNVECTLQIEDIKVPVLCPILGVPLVRRTMLAPSIDRIDCKKGYTPDNIQIISRKANTMKSDASLLELICLGEWAKKRLKKECHEY